MKLKMIKSKGLRDAKDIVCDFGFVHPWPKIMTVTNEFWAQCLTDESTFQYVKGEVIRGVKAHNCYKLLKRESESLREYIYSELAKRLKEAK